MFGNFEKHRNEFFIYQKIHSKSDIYWSPKLGSGKSVSQNIIGI